MAKVSFLKILVVIALMLFSPKEAQVSQVFPKAKKTIYFYFINFSAFHQNGDVVWLDESCYAITQKFRQTTSEIRQFKIPNKDCDWIHASLSKIDTASVHIKPHLAVPDEVQIQFGSRDNKGKLASWTVMDQDWPNQSADVQKFNQIAQRVLANSEGVKPLPHKESLPSKPIDIYLPSEFDLSEVIKINPLLKR